MPELPESAEIVIVGAGIMGCSIAYHLAERGVTGVVVLEKDFIGRGSTADAAGGIRMQFSTRANIELMQISMPYWEQFEERFGQYIDFRQQGYLFLLSSQENVDVFRQNLALQQSMGVPARWVTPEEIGELNPAVNLDDILGGAFCPRDGERITSVQAGNQAIAAGTVICAAGAYTGVFGDMAGVSLPVVPVRRMSWVTGPFDEIAPTVPFTIDFERSLYFHPEGNGFLFGMSDPDEPVSWNRGTTQAWLERTIDALVERAPAFANATVRNGWGGLYEVTPDHNPLVGPVEGLANLLAAAGFSGHGFMQGPAIGKLMAELVLDGQFHSVDLTDFRPSRFSEGEPKPEHNVV